MNQNNQQGTKGSQFIPNLSLTSLTLAPAVTGSWRNFDFDDLYRIDDPEDHARFITETLAQSTAQQEEERRRREQENSVREAKERIRRQREQEKIRELEHRKYQRNQKRREYQLLMDIMLQLNEDRMSELKTAFATRTNRDKFVTIMRGILLDENYRGDQDRAQGEQSSGDGRVENHWGGSNEEKLVLNLIGIFNDIDFDGDAHITWDDIDAFLVNTARSDKFGMEKIKNYRLFMIPDALTADENIKHIKYFPGWNRIITCGTHHRCKVVHPSSYKVLNVLPDMDCSVLAVEFVSQHNLLVTSTSDLALRFWDTANDMQLKFEERLSASESSQTVLLYDHNNDVLLSGSRRGLIHLWDYRYVEEKRDWRFVNRAQSKKVHDDVITDMIILESNKLLVTCSLDGNINVIDMNKWIILSNLTQSKGQSTDAPYSHRTGFRSLTYSHDYDTLIAVGSSHEPYLWPSISHSYMTSRPFQLRDQKQPHQHVLVNVLAIPHTPQVITADKKGMVKVWDIRTMQCVQTMFVENVMKNIYSFDQNSVNSFTYVPHERCIVTGGERTYVYCYDYLLHPNDADDSGVLFAEYNPKTISFTTSSSSSQVKTWDALSGCVSNTFSNLVTGHITAMCVDDRGRKIFVGTDSGEIKCFNQYSGFLLKQYPSRNSEITSITYCATVKSLVVTAADGSVVRFFDRDQSETLQREFPKFHSNPIVCSVYSNARRILATADVPLDECSSSRQSNLSVSRSFSHIAVWDVVLNQRIFDTTSRTGNINCLHFAGDFPLLLAGGNGFVCAWALRSRNELVVHWNLKHSQPPKPVKKGGSSSAITDTPIVVVRLAFRQNNYHLYVADEIGYVHVYDFGPVLRSLKLVDDGGEGGGSDGGSDNGQSIDPSQHASSTMAIGGYTLQAVETEAETHSWRSSAKSFTSPLSSSRSVRQLLTVPHFLFCWRAHQDSITQIQAIRDPAAILTSSLDRTVIIWNIDGRKLDTLRQSKTDTTDMYLSSKESKERQRLERDTVFNFPVDLDRIRTEEANLVKNVMSRIRNRLNALHRFRHTASRSAVKRSASRAILEAARSQSQSSASTSSRATFITQHELEHRQSPS